ncbi:hypothetical protein [Streptomyces longhuiensis]|uniref:hypothetical protein n=1 Tax=Streptomyces longhuiensis TaxID=2880933 RepID=UPI001D0AE4DB|nr:hypothetical protein [Streptomyces longhuiensis]UDM05440.1 hypothetical protein LGI35_45100 [Streptomyces longhuiensis]
MTLCLLISKYDKARREGEIADWTSFDDIGESFDGRVLTAEEYQRTEDLYVFAVEHLAHEAGVNQFEMRDIILSSPEPSWLGNMYDGRVVDLGTALRLLRRMLRDGDVSCSLRSADVLKVAVETDFYLSVQLPDSAVDSLAQIERMGLYPVRVPCWEEDEGELISRPADAEFWAEVASESHIRRSPMVILERWARGSYGERWHLAEEGNPRPVAESVRPHSLITAITDLEIQWARRDELVRTVRSLMDGDDPRVVIVARAEGAALQTVTCGEGVEIPSETELPAGDELGYFLWPEDDAPLIQAVVPGEDGRIVSRWPDEGI